MNNARAPIGHWLKHLDRLIDATLDRALADDDVGRRHWQTMNMLRAGPQAEDGIAEGLRPFWGDGGIALDEVVGDLTRRGWIDRGADAEYALTPSGEAAHAALAERVERGRRLLMEGLTPHDYQATVAALQRMAGNLEDGLRQG